MTINAAMFSIIGIGMSESPEAFHEGTTEQLISTETLKKCNEKSVLMLHPPKLNEDHDNQNRAVTITDDFKTEHLPAQTKLESEETSKTSEVVKLVKIENNNETNMSKFITDQQKLVHHLIKITSEVAAEQDPIVDSSINFSELHVVENHLFERGLAVLQKFDPKTFSSTQ